VRNSDVARLNPNQKSGQSKYLSDTAIDFIAMYIKENSIPVPGVKPFVCSSLFYSHIRSNFLNFSGKVDTTWYETNIHEHNMLLSINHGRDHYSATSVINPWTRPVIYFYEPKINYHSEFEIQETYSAYLTSLRHRAFLSEESIPAPTFITLEGPVQLNGYDCALFCLEFFQFSLSMSVEELQSENPYVDFHEESWSPADIDRRRHMYYHLMTELSENYAKYQADTIQGNLNYASSADSDDNDSSAVVIVEKSPTITITPADVDQHDRDRAFEEFLIDRFGSIPAYISRIPSVKDQDLLRKTFDEKRDLLSNWTTKKSGINCGYLAANKDKLYIFEKFIYEPVLNWAPTNSHAYDACPHDPNRCPDLYGYQSHLAMEVLGKLFICGWPLYSEDVGHRFILWTFNWTLCWDPRKDYILYDTFKDTFTIVQGTVRILTLSLCGNNDNCNLVLFLLIITAPIR